MCAAAFISAKQGRCRRWWRPSKDPKGRFGYVGVDNWDAGATAAYLTNEWLGDSPASVLVTLSSNAFRGEEEREMGFRGEMHALDRDPTIGAVYSIGGSNVATIRAFERRGRRYRVFIAHDLDEDNRMLLRARKISAVLHHDLRADANIAGRLTIQAHGGMSGVDMSMSTSSR
jgi:LacI family transcriptional regulator